MICTVVLSSSVIGEFGADRTATGAAAAPEQSVQNNKNSNNDAQEKVKEIDSSMAALQLSFGVLEISESPLVRVRNQLKELM